MRKVLFMLGAISLLVTGCSQGVQVKEAVSREKPVPEISQSGYYQSDGGAFVGAGNLISTPTVDGSWRLLLVKEGYRQ